MHSHDVSCAAFPPHHFPRNHGNVNNYFPVFKHCKGVSLCLLFLVGNVVQQINMKEIMQGPFAGWPNSHSVSLGRMTVCEKKRESGKGAALIAHLAQLSVVTS